MDKLQVPTGRAFQTKQAMAYQALRDGIMSGKLTPGTHLVIDEVARRLGLSAIPVREALQTLQSDRLVELRPHVGAIVTDIDTDAVREIFTLLECLEIAAFRLAVEHVTNLDLAGLRNLQTKMESAAKSDDDARWVELNRRFHGQVPLIARAPRIAEMIERVSSDWVRLRHLRFTETEHPHVAESHRQHLAMIDALADRNVDALIALTQQHNRDALAVYLPKK
ncbi:MAG: GntR family transcriptional regulator [Planctomycetota bacterium]